MKQLQLLALMLLCVQGQAALEIAAPAQALTFARFVDASGTHVIIVRSYDDDQVTGLVVEDTPDADPIDLYRKLGYAALQARIETATRPPAGAVTGRSWGLSVSRTTRWSCRSSPWNRWRWTSPRTPSA